MKKNGFVFIETIVAIVVLTASLLLLYSSFSKILQTERTRVYYDNVSYVYRTWNIQKMINDLGINSLLNDSNYNIIKNLKNGNWITDINKKNLFNEMIVDFEIEKLLVFKTDLLNELKKCTKNSTNSYCDGFDDNMIKYIKSISFTEKPLNILIVEYKSQGNNSKNYYSWVGVNE